MELEVGGPEGHAFIGNLALKTKMDSLVGMDAHGQPIASQGLARLQWKHQMRRTAKLDDHFGPAIAHGLAGAQVKWHTAPAPVFDLEARDGKGGRAGVRVDAWLLAIAFILGGADLRRSFL